jgi:hypothetical protein
MKAHGVEIGEALSTVFLPSMLELPADQKLACIYPLLQDTYRTLQQVEGFDRKDATENLFNLFALVTGSPFSFNTVPPPPSVTRGRGGSNTTSESPDKKHISVINQVVKNHSVSENACLENVNSESENSSVKPTKIVTASPIVQSVIHAHIDELVRYKSAGCSEVTLSMIRYVGPNSSDKQSITFEFDGKKVYTATVTIDWLIENIEYFAQMEIAKELALIVRYNGPNVQVVQFDEPSKALVDMFGPYFFDKKETSPGNFQYTVIVKANSKGARQVREAGKRLGMDMAASGAMRIAGTNNNKLHNRQPDGSYWRTRSVESNPSAVIRLEEFEAAGLLVAQPPVVKWFQHANHSRQVNLSAYEAIIPATRPDGTEDESSRDIKWCMSQLSSGCNETDVADGLITLRDKAAARPDYVSRTIEKAKQYVAK